MTTTRPLVALRAARLFDGTNLVENPRIVLDGEHVAVVGATVPGIEVTDLGDVTILPGLIDTHVHLAFDARADPVGAPPKIVMMSSGLIADGALIVAATDAGIGPPKPHSPLPSAAPQLVSAGMSPLDALRTVTSVAAGVCGLASRKGSLVPGFDADLVVVGGDPRTDPGCPGDVRAVYLGGRIVA